MLLDGKTGIVFGVANKRSLAWAIARRAAEEGARIALTYQGERLEENARELAAALTNPLVLPCDVARDEVDPVELLRPHDQPQSVRVGAEVEGSDRHPFLDEQPTGPGADAAQRPGDEEPVAHDHPPLIRLQQSVTRAAEAAGAPRCSSAGDNNSPNRHTSSVRH